MKNLNLHGRNPKDLPDKETIEDILLELKDTNKFEIKWISLYNVVWQFNYNEIHNWIERSEVVIMEIDKSEQFFDFYTETSNCIIKEIRYDILRYPTRLDIRIVDSNYNLDIINTSSDVYLRLKDYLGPDVIMSNFTKTDFSIDFILTICKIK